MKRVEVCAWVYVSRYHFFADELPRRRFVVANRRTNIIASLYVYILFSWNVACPDSRLFRFDASASLKKEKAGGSRLRPLHRASTQLRD
jgi:hypothetical protein